MDRLRAWFKREEEEYAPLNTSTDENEDAPTTPLPDEAAFSWIEYGIFVLLGMAMLWAWNMFLAAGPYLRQRFTASPWIVQNFQASLLCVSSLTNLVGIILLTWRQKGANYPRRIAAGLVINTVALALLAVSTKLFTDVSAEVYFGFVMAMVLAAGAATALFQNGIFAFVTGYGQTKYTQGIMVGQGIAGVLPCIAQIGLVLGLSSRKHNLPSEPGAPGAVPQAPPVPSSAALAYFVTAVGISAGTFFAFSLLMRRKATAQLKANIHAAEGERSSATASKPVPMLVLLSKLRWLAAAVFIAFCITMQYPVYTQRIVSVVPVDKAPAILWPSSFVPLAFLTWNSGDLVGRILPAFPMLLVDHKPRLLFALGLCRLAWIPLYWLCNIGGNGAVVSSDIFYLLAVQFTFGITNGYIGSSCMMGAGRWVDPDEREAAGGFMGLCLIIGLTTGSFLSFFASGR